MEGQFDWIITTFFFHTLESLGLVLFEVCPIYGAILAVLSAVGCPYCFYGNLHWHLCNALMACGYTNGLYGRIGTEVAVFHLLALSI